MKLGKRLLSSGLLAVMVSGLGLVLGPFGSSALAQNAVPQINQPLVPESAHPQAAFTLTVSGAGFVAGSVIYWNGGPEPTTFVSSQQLTACIGPSDTARAGTFPVTVVSPGPGGGTSNVDFFEIIPQMHFQASNRFPFEHVERITAADLNGDGKMDLVAAVSGTSTVSVRLGNGDGTFQPEVLYATGAQSGYVITGDLNGDGKIDVAILCSGVVSVLLGNGDGTFQPHIDSPVDQGILAFSIASGDFNGDGKLDLVVGYQDPSSNAVSVLIGNGDGTFQLPIDYATGNEPGSVAVADFNRDGKLDIVAANFAVFGGHTVSVLLGNGDGTFQPQVQYTTSNGALSVIAADFNGDGKVDLAVDCACGTSKVCGRPGVISILLGNGDGTFGTHVDYDAHEFPYTVIAGDFDGDGILDLAVANLDSSDMSVLPGLGNGKFGQAVNFPALANAVGATTGDFTKSGKLDVVLGTRSGFTLMHH
jgi:hypothetical protein